MSAVLYIEGGGDNRRLGAEFREGWKAFLTNAGLSGRMPKVARGGTRQQTFNCFTTALADSRCRIVPLLLVDSEAPVAAAHSVWQHLHTRDRWKKPDTARDDQAFLMVPGHGNLVHGRPQSTANIFRGAFHDERHQEMASTGRPAPRNGFRRAEKGYRQVLESLCQRESRLRITETHQCSSRRSRLPACKGSPESAESFVIVSLVHIRPAG